MVMALKPNLGLEDGLSLQLTVIKLKTRSPTLAKSSNRQNRYPETILATIPLALRATYHYQMTFQSLPPRQLPLTPKTKPPNSRPNAKI